MGLDLGNHKTTVLIFAGGALVGSVVGGCVTIAVIRHLLSPRSWSWRKRQSRSSSFVKASAQHQGGPGSKGWSNGGHANGIPFNVVAPTSLPRSKSNNSSSSNGSSLKRTDSGNSKFSNSVRKELLVEAQSRPSSLPGGGGALSSPLCLPPRSLPSSGPPTGASSGAQSSSSSSLQKQQQHLLAAEPGSDGPATSLAPPQQLTLAAQRLAQGDDIVVEQFTRNVQFFGQVGQLRVHNAFVVVVGLGGVGSHAAAALLRSGVGHLRLVDFDQVTLSSLNRHAVATREDVGTPKALCLQKHFARIFPESKVDARVAMFDAKSSEDILSGSPDYVLDCIDNLDTKVCLLASCLNRGLRVLCAGGAGGRADPTRIRIADLAESCEDPLARAVRHHLRRDHSIAVGVPSIFSLERPKAKLIPCQVKDNADPLDYQVIPGFRVGTIPVLGTIPALFGMAMATHVVTSIAGMEVKTEPVVRLSPEHFSLLFQRLIEREELRFGSVAGVEVDIEEVVYVVKELWRGRSFREVQFQELGRGMFKTISYMTLTRWDQSQPASVTNLILCTFKQAEEHDATNLEHLKENEPDLYAYVEGKLAQARQDFYYAQ